MKPLDIIQDANRNLLRNKGRTALTVVAIFIGAMTLTVTNGIGAGVSDYIDKQLGNIGAEDVLQVVAKSENSDNGPQKYDADRSVSGAEFGVSLPMINGGDLEKIRAVPGVVSADAFVSVTPDYIAGKNGEKYQLAASPFIAGTNLAMAAGSLPDNSSSENQIVLLPDYPAALGFSSAEEAVGKKVTIGVTSALGEQSEIEATVIGVQENTLTSIGGASINQALTDALYDLQSEGQPSAAKDRYIAAVARVSKGATEAEMEEVKSRLDAEGYKATTIKDQIGSFKQVIGAVVTVLNVFAALALLAASFGIVNTLLMAVQERTKEIGLMKAMGLSGRKIFALFSLEAILIGFWGSLLGSLAGIAIGSAANNVASNTFLKDLPGFSLTLFTPQSVALIMLIIMTIAFIAGTMPARRASRKDPIEALRYE